MDLTGEVYRIGGIGMTGSYRQTLKVAGPQGTSVLIIMEVYNARVKMWIEPFCVEAIMDSNLVSELCRFLAEANYFATGNTSKTSPIRLVPAKRFPRGR